MRAVKIALCLLALCPPGIAVAQPMAGGMGPTAPWLNGGTPAISSVTWASIPSPGTAGVLVRCSDCGTKGSLWMDDGTRWKPAGGCAVFASKDTATAGIGNVESLPFQYLFPANLLQLGDRIRLRFTMTKSGTTDVGTLRFRVGTAGTTADTQLYNQSALSAANKEIGFHVDFRIDNVGVGTATIEQLAASGQGGNNAGYTGAGSAAIVGPVAIADVSNPLYFSIGILSGGTNDTVGLTEAQLMYCSSAN